MNMAQLVKGMSFTEFFLYARVVALENLVADLIKRVPPEERTVLPDSLIRLGRDFGPLDADVLEAHDGLVRDGVRRVLSAAAERSLQNPAG